MTGKTPMILLDCSKANWQKRRLGAAWPTGQLLTPLTNRSYNGCGFGIDNGAFARFDEEAFLSLLKRMEPHVENCLFVAVPDVPFSARRTLEVFEAWHERLRYWPLAYVAQDGAEDLPIPWDTVKAIFIGGTTAFKMSRAAFEIAKAAKLLHKWVHVGRVNTGARLSAWRDVSVQVAGRWVPCCDSVDGTGISRYDHMWDDLMAHLHNKPRKTLFDGQNIGAMVSSLDDERAHK